MSRHRKVKALDYDEEYDDFYGALDDDHDFEDEDFQAKYLGSGIDLTNDKQSNHPQDKLSKPQQSPSFPSEQKPKTNHAINYQESSPYLFEKLTESSSTDENLSNQICPSIFKSPAVSRDLISISSPSQHFERDSSTASISSDLTRIAVQHLDKHQWRLPLMEMDKKFRDKTYYKHYTDAYISSLHSKLGHFLADNRMKSNPMKHHVQSELDNHKKYSRMFELLINYYQSVGVHFFSFSTPSPEEEIIIGCRLGTKAKQPKPPKESALAKDEQKTARFEYHGKPVKAQPPAKQVHAAAANQSSKSNKTSKEKLSAPAGTSSFTKFKEKSKNVAASGAQIATDTSSQKRPVVFEYQQWLPNAKPATRQSAPSKQQKAQAKIEADSETMKLRTAQTIKEYDEHFKSARPRVNLVVVGHVDAGKSTLVGHLLYKLGHVTSKQMHRNEIDSQRSGKASFKFAWALDETSEERARGVTIDIALTHFSTQRKDIAILDAPGHVDFIPAVISGAAQADAALLVVDATRGEFETGFSSGGQTREHTFLVRSLGVKCLIVAVNKMDNVDWSWARFCDIVEQLKPFLKQAGFNTSTEVQFVAVSGLSGENLCENRAEKLLKQSSHPQLEGENVTKFAQLPCLINAIDQMAQPERMVDKPTRVCITDVFKGMSSGVFLGCRVAAGKIEGKQKLTLLPPGDSCEVKQVEVRDTKSNTAFAGDICTAVVTGIDMNKFCRGYVMCDPLVPCAVTNRFQARIIMFQGTGALLLKGTPVEIYINGSSESGEVRKLVSLLNKNTGELVQRKPRCLVQNSSAVMQLKLSRVVCCELYEDNKELGRFLVRSYGKTIAAGLITKIKSAKVARRGGTKMKSK